MSGSTLAYEPQDGEIEINAGRDTTKVVVANTGDRAVQVGSHYHFYEANAALQFDRDAAYGKHLAIPSGLAIRFEPGDEREVELVDFGGRRVLYGFANLVDGALDNPEIKAAAAERLKDFLDNSNAEVHIPTPTEEA
ncbi:urease subunit beta [Corynebacterium anserum]|uniref:urease subunit beta n=1 Tax=Corynebacterium anserum TaxID=2684406 RepID=UPI001FEB3B6B|nr:urease subunit beta [Corynebacterium anserum]